MKVENLIDGKEYLIKDESNEVYLVRYNENFKRFNNHLGAFYNEEIIGILKADEIKFEELANN